MSATLERPRSTILGGPNGAGKSTTFARLTEWGYRSDAWDGESMWTWYQRMIGTTLERS